MVVQQLLISGLCVSPAPVLASRLHPCLHTLAHTRAHIDLQQESLCALLHRKSTLTHTLPICLTLQVFRCTKRFAHDWRTCPFAHPTENARRRDPNLYRYSAVACPDYKQVCVGRRLGLCVVGLILSDLSSKLMSDTHNPAHPLLLHAFCLCTHVWRTHC